jgi:hypothetical protein
MAITQTLNAKYPDWTQEDWGSLPLDQRVEQTPPQFSASFAMQTMWHCGHLRERPRRHAISQYVHARLPEVPSVLRDHDRFEPDSVLGWFWHQKCTFSVVQNRVPLHMVRQWNYYNSPVIEHGRPGPRSRKIFPSFRASVVRQWTTIGARGDCGR